MAGGTDLVGDANNVTIGELENRHLQTAFRHACMSGAMNEAYTHTYMARLNGQDSPLPTKAEINDGTDACIANGIPQGATPAGLMEKTDRNMTAVERMRKQMGLGSGQ